MSTSLIQTNNADHLTLRSHYTRSALEQFLNTATTSMGRGTFHNQKEAIESAVKLSHNQLMAVDRGVYALAACLEGTTDYNRQQVILQLLQTPKDSQPSVLSEASEYQVLSSLLISLPPQRVFKLYGILREQRVNNARTRRLLLTFLLNQKQVVFWSVKYRRKCRDALQHVLGQRKASIVRSILAKPLDDQTDKEKAIVKTQLIRFIEPSSHLQSVLEAVSFALGNDQFAGKGFRAPILKARVQAKDDWQAAANLPYEVAEGLRSTYHKETVSAKDTLRVTANSLGKTQAKVLQRKAQQEGAQVSFNPANYDAIELYLYAFEQGMTDAIALALQDKAKYAAQRLTMSANRIAIVVDASQSMFGHNTQALRPLAITLALRDVLSACAETASVHLCGGRTAQHPLLVRPSGATNLAEALVEALQTQLDAVFILSDGYENAPAGRVDEVIRIAQTQLQLSTSFYHINPVPAQEAQGVRQLSERMEPWAVQSVEALQLAATKMQILQWFDQGKCNEGVKLMANVVNKRLAA